MMNGHQEGSALQLPTPLVVDFLIVGAGPAGASLACFMASYGEPVQNEFP